MIPSDLKPRGRILAEVEPDFVGMPLLEWLEWQRKGERAEVERYVASSKFRAVVEKQAWFKKGIASQPIFKKGVVQT